MRFQTLDEWLDWQETLHPRKIDLGLDRVSEVWKRIVPEPWPVTVITVAGTNGKGSSVALLVSVLQAAGITTFDQLELDVSVMENLTLTKEEKKDLDLGADLGLPGLFCPQCGGCLAQCKERLDIPTLMRSYMYAYGYGNLSSAKEALESLKRSTNPCGGCDDCGVDCAMGFDVRDRVRDIARLGAVSSDFLT